MIFDPATTEEKPKYLWDLATGRNGDVYIAAGAPAVVYRVPAGGGKAEVLFETADQHIRCLMMAPDGTLWAGSDGAGVIYRIDTKIAGAKPFAAYAAPRREITSLTMDEAGNVYAAGVGARAAMPLPPLMRGESTMASAMRARSDSVTASTSTMRAPSPAAYALMSPLCTMGSGISPTREGVCAARCRTRFESVIGFNG